MENIHKNDGLTIGQKVVYYFTQLEFYSDGLRLGDEVEAKSAAWTIGVYLLTSAGIFCRQITNFPKVNLNLANLQWNVAIASLIFGMVILPYIIKRINKSKPTPGLPQILIAFTFGFCMDFASSSFFKYVLKV